MAQANEVEDRSILEERADLEASSPEAGYEGRSPSQPKELVECTVQVGGTVEPITAREGVSVVTGEEIGSAEEEGPEDGCFWRLLTDAGYTSW